MSEPASNMEVKKIDTVLMVDDNSVDNFNNVILLKKADLASEIIVHQNGRDALSFLSNLYKKNIKCPSLIFLDLYMTGVDGFEVLKEFNSMDFNFIKNTILIILTNSAEPDAIIRLKEQGNFHYLYIRKPLRMDNLFDIHHKYFRSDQLFFE